MQGQGFAKLKEMEYVCKIRVFAKLKERDVKCYASSRSFKDRKTGFIEIDKFSKTTLVKSRSASEISRLQLFRVLIRHSNPRSYDICAFATIDFYDT